MLLLLLLIETYNKIEMRSENFLNTNKKVEIESLYNNNLLDYLRSKINDPEKWL